jgi:hypothetical protein
VWVGGAGWQSSGDGWVRRREVVMKGGDEPEARCSVLTGSVSAQDKDAYRSELFQYRYETVALLQKYLQVSLDLGRLPSVLGGEMFRAKVTSYRVSCFEDLVIFVTDVEACFNRLGEVARRFLVLSIFQEYSKQETAARMGCDVRHSQRIYADALDEMSEILLRFGVLEPSDWIGHVVAAEGWFEGCPVLRRDARSVARNLPPKKPSASVHETRPKVLQMPVRVG